MGVKHKMETKKPMCRQIISTVLGNLMTASIGAANGWASVNFVDLQKDDTSFPSGPLTLEQATLVVSIIYAGAIIGNSVFPYIVKKCGSKRTLMAVVFPQIISYLLIIFAQTPYYLYAARLMTGFVGSGLFISLTIFVTEIAHDNIRATLNSVRDPLLNFGTVFALLLSKRFDYVEQAKYHLIFPIIFLVSFVWVPESPEHLLNVQNENAANKAHKFFKGTELGKQPVPELNNTSTEDNSKLSWRDFVSRRARKAFIISFSLLCLNIMHGYNIFIAYVTEIFTNSSSNVSAIDASILVSSMLMASSFIFLNLIDRAGRRTFYIYSSWATTIGLVLYVIYLLFLEGNHAFDWVPSVGVSYVISVSSMGMSPVPFLVMVEIFPKKIKHYGVTGYITLSSFLLFVSSTLYPLIKAYIGLLGWMSIFAIASLGNALFGIFILPETGGKSHEAIMQLLD